MINYSGLDYLKIDIANSKGLDKLQFEERINWFNNNININQETTNQELLTLVQEHRFEEPELGLAGLMAYRDTLANKPTGYRVALDSSNSGTICPFI